MKLKKSIEKAKQQRQSQMHKPSEEISSTEIKTEPLKTEPTGVPDMEKKAFTPKWAPPVYSESRAVTLDREELAQNRCVCMLPDTPETEYYKILRTSIQQRTREKNWNTIMITSTQAGEGKTLTAINLATAFAKEYDQTVLLVDCDLRRQSIHKYLNFSFEKGIVDYLVNDCRLKDIIVWPKIEKLSIISGGKTISNSTELLGSPKMKSLVHEIKHRYNDRYVIYDVPPILGGADTIAFAPMVDCILMVVQEGRTSIKDINRALDMIPKEKFLGFVLNRRTSTLQKYYYY